MDSNKKKDREERGLLRVAELSRKHLNLDNQPLVEIWTSDSTKDRLTKAIKLSPFKAYTEDIKKAKALVVEGKLTEDSLERVAFVTTDVYKQLSSFKSLWVSTSLSDTVIGADPEFLLMKEGKVVSAHYIEGFTKYTKLGSDGPMAEVRPDPALTPEELVNNIKKVLLDEKNYTKIQQYDWISTAYFEDNTRDYPVGSHIHFGNPHQIASLSEAVRTNLFRVVTRVLDELLAIPLIKIDNTEGSHRRIRCKMGMNGNMGGYGLGYGYFGDMRLCNGRLEYRTLSGKIMANPALLTAVYGVAKTITDSIFDLVIAENCSEEFFCPKIYKGLDLFADSFDTWDQIELTKQIDCIIPSKEIRNKLHKGGPGLINKQFLSQWLEKLKGLSRYNTGEVYINYLLEILKGKTSNTNKTTNIKTTWIEENNG